MTKTDFIQHLKSSNLLKQFSNVSNESEERLNNVARTAFKIFDMNEDGYVDKKEFKRMTNSKKISKKVIDVVFEVCYRIIILKLNIFVQRCDLDNDGKLDFDEFRAMIIRSKVSCNPEGDSTTVSTSASSTSTSGASSRVSTATSSRSRANSNRDNNGNTSQSTSRTGSVKTTSSRDSKMSTDISFSLSSNMSSNILASPGYSPINQDDDIIDDDARGQPEPRRNFLKYFTENISRFVSRGDRHRRRVN